MASPNHLKIGGAYLAVALLYSYPLATHFSTGTLALGLNYTLFANSSLIWENLRQFQNPLIAERVFFPVGYSIHEGFLPSFLHLLFGGVVQPVSALNLSLLFSFVVAATGAFALCRFAGADRASAFLGGLYFGFCPQHLANVGTYPIFHLEWLPWFLFCLLKFGQTGDRKMLAGAQIFFIAGALSSWYFAVFLLLLTAVYLPFGFLSVRKLAALAAGFAVSAVILLPFTPVWLIGPYGAVGGGLPFASQGSADLVSFLVPAWHHWLFAAPVQSLQQEWAGDPSLRANYLGYSVLAVALAAIWLSSTNRRLHAFLVAVFCISIVLSLGPFLTVGGPGSVSASEPWSGAVRLPVYWVVDQFPFSATRAFSRYSILAALALSVLFALGISAVRGRLQGSNRRAAAWAMGALLFFEFWPNWPHPLREPVEPLQFYSRLAESKENFSVIELPFRSNLYRIPYYASTHGKNTIGGAVDKPFHRFRDWAVKVPLFRQLVYVGTPIANRPRLWDIFGPESEGFFPDVAAAFQVRYVLVHKYDEFTLSFGDYFVPEPLANKFPDLLAGHFQLVYEDESIAVFEPKKSPARWLYPEFGDGWSSVEEHADYVNRLLLGAGADVFLHSSHPTHVDVDFELTAIYIPSRTVRILLNGVSLFEETIKERIERREWKRLALRELKLTSGRNVLRIETDQTARSGAEIYGSGDARKISLLIRDFRIHRKIRGLESAEAGPQSDR